MNTFIEFIKEHWFQLLCALAFVVEIIFIFIKRKPKSLDDFKLAVSDCLKFVASFVSDVEKPGCGELKKKAVEDYSLRFIERRLGRSLTFSEISLILPDIDSQIEAVLKAPTKKKEKINEK